MPKKTKRQKIAAQQHKKRMIEVSELTKSPVVHIEHTSHQAPITLNATPIKSHKKILISDLNIDQFKKDLMKSLTICTLLIILEISIYIGQLNGVTLNTILPF